jgi:hypothetical protein
LFSRNPLGPARLTNFHIFVVWQVLERVMRENHVSIRGGLAAIQQLLSWRVLTEEQVDSILLTALKIEAAQSPAGLTLKKGAEPTWELSPLAVEIAVRDVCGRSIPNPAKTPSVRSKEEIDAMIQDKQERGLLANIISPQVRVVLICWCEGGCF